MDGVSPARYPFCAEIRLLEMSSMGIGSKPCLDIRPSQNQINDRSISFSQMGKRILDSSGQVHQSKTTPAAPKFRNSFMGSTSGETINKAQRPTSIISVNSLSSGTSSSCGSCSGASNRNTGIIPVVVGQQNIEEEEGQEVLSGKESAADVNKSLKGGRKGAAHLHHRSTTLVSQCSMGR